MADRGEDPGGARATSSAASLLPAPLRILVLAAAFCGLAFDGVELGLMPVASLSVSKSLMGSQYTEAAAGDWFARFTASLMLGAAIGGIVLGNLGDRIGRTKAMGVSILFYSVFAGLGGFVGRQEEMLVLRFLVGLGVGGMWPNGVVLVSECWPKASRPVVAGVMGAGVNFGILLVSQLARYWPITAEAWRWIFRIAAFPAALGIFVLLALPESPKWLAARRLAPAQGVPARAPVKALFRPPLLGPTAIGIVLASIPLVGAWAASKWMIPWADSVASAERPGYKAVVQGWWALGATLGSFAGAQVASLLGRRVSYFLVSLATTGLTAAMFQLSAPLEATFLPIVFAQGFVATLFFGWLPLCLPELFPTRVRSTGSGIAMNSGRFATAFGVLFSGALFVALGGSYPMVGAFGALVYATGAIAIWFAPETSGKDLED